ncbi:hypothetical protein NP493_478g02009 [Ridgeia piscesae]|uniref:Nuclear pore complex protein Nup155 n=1 Tax=Ridgeia piscesae TaxID=27915 RepID=A0AAD9KYB2_RIDPI|nr:hypothetical protein NP493_478g02009 [Ridgeia piscesae]
MSSSNILGMVGQATVVQESIDHASMFIDQSLVADYNYQDLSDLLQVPKHVQPTVSGLLDFDYPSLADPKIGLGSVRELGDIRKVPLPVELVEQFGHMQCNCLMGLFPDIGRAWLSVDSDIFVWNFEDGSDLAYFDGLSETILSAGLVRPKPGVFQQHIEFLLVLATPVDIVLLGVSFSKHFEGSAFGEMHLLPEPLFTVPTDNTHVLNITGTENGRIFMTGKDGCLYELAYQAEDGWFSRKCKKINHSTSRLSFIVPSFLNFSFIDDDPLLHISIDDSRKLLYTLSEKGTIQLFDLGEDGKGMSRVAAISQQTTLQNSALVARTIDKSNFKPIVYIAAIPKTESINVHLVAITHTGARLYFTTSAFYQRSRPSMLSLIHVRMPPGFSASAAPQRPTNVRIAHYRKGTMLLAAANSDDGDLFWTTSPDSFPFQMHMRETHEVMPIQGRTWAITEMPSWGSDMGEICLMEEMGKADPPAVVTQHLDPPRKFVLINSQGCYLMTKQQPVDQLRQLLLNTSPDSEQVKAFFKLHREQACATCLILACTTRAVDKEVIDSATRAYFLYGGEPEYNFAAPAGAACMSTTFGESEIPHQVASFLSTPRRGGDLPQTSTPFPNVTQQLQFQSPASNTFAPGSPEVIFSGKHNGLCLYLSRILRPLWACGMVKEMPAPSGQKKYLMSRFYSEQLSWILVKLNAVHEFMARNSQFNTPIVTERMADHHDDHTPNKGTNGPSHCDEQDVFRCFVAEADNQERQSLKQLQILVARMCESLALWKILCDHQFHVICAALSVDQQNTLRGMTFRNFVVMGREISRMLIHSLINMYLGDNAATDAISHRLREVCPTLYSPEDAICSKGNEKMQIARTAQQPTDRNKALQEALQLFKDVAAEVDLPTVCSKFAAVGFYSGIVDLTLTASKKRDPQCWGLHFYKNGEPPADSEGMIAYSNRMDCYKCITETLNYLLSTSLSHPQAPSVPKLPGPPQVTDDPNRLACAEAEKHSEEVFRLSLKSDDELFHVALYDWLINKSLSEKLLEIQSPYLEDYLKRAASLHPDNRAMLDLLWRYYEKSKNYSAAARILAKLAERRSTDINLGQRIEYLSRATMCAKSSTLRTTSAVEGEFLHELEEKMEVAAIQLQIFELLSKQQPNRPDFSDALGQLNAELVNITSLYSDFADRFGLSESKLAIIHCAGHHDPTLVESLWQDIIDKELDLTSNQTPRTQIKVLSDKIVALGQLYSSTEKYFPLAFIVKCLEEKSAQFNFDTVDPAFVLRSLQKIGLNIPRLHDVYEHLYKSKDACWKNFQKPLHLLTIIVLLLNTFADMAASFPAYERRHFTTVALDAIAAHLVELLAESVQDNSVRILIQSLRDVQAKLERLV